MNPNQARLNQRLAALDGARIPGGCGHCDAYRTTAVDAFGIGHLTVHHDDWCPWYGARRADPAPRVYLTRGPAA